MTLKYPIKLSSSVRDADGIPLALANTEDGGSAVVVWKNSAWVLSKGFNVSDVMRSPKASEDIRARFSNKIFFVIKYF